jgi:lysyl-tRNA synthetase class II
MNNVLLIGKLTNNIMLKEDNDTMSVLSLEIVNKENKQVIECLFTNTELCEKIHKYLKINDIVGVKGHLEVIKNEICVICDKVTFLSSKESEVKNDI